MATDKNVVGFVSENRQNFVGFCRFFSTDKNRHKKFAKPTNCRFFVGFLSVFCRFGSKIMVFRQIFSEEIFINQHSLSCKMTDVTLTKWLGDVILSSWSLNYKTYIWKISFLNLEWNPAWILLLKITIFTIIWYKILYF